MMAEVSLVMYLCTLKTKNYLKIYIILYFIIISQINKIFHLICININMPTVTLKAIKR